MRVYLIQRYLFMFYLFSIYLHILTKLLLSLVYFVVDITFLKFFVQRNDIGYVLRRIQMHLCELVPL